MATNVTGAKRGFIWEPSDGRLQLYVNGTAGPAFGPTDSTNTDGSIIKIGSSSTPASTPVASQAANQSMHREIYGLDHAGAYGVYTRSFIRTAGISADAARIFGTVQNVAADTVRGLHCTLSFGDTGTVTGLGCAAEFTLALPNTTPLNGTMYGVKSAIDSAGATTDPNGATTLAYYAAVNQGNATGGADVDDDAVLFDIVGHTVGTGNMVAPESGTVTDSIRIKVAGTIYHIALMSSIS